LRSQASTPTWHPHPGIRAHRRRTGPRGDAPRHPLDMPQPRAASVDPTPWPATPPLPHCCGRAHRGEGGRARNGGRASNLPRSKLDRRRDLVDHGAAWFENTNPEGSASHQILLQTNIDSSYYMDVAGRTALGLRRAVCQAALPEHRGAPSTKAVAFGNDKDARRRARGTTR
jgi:hypothetical protein